MAMPSNEATSVRALWERFAPMVFRLLRRTFGPEHPVDDVVQDVFLRVFADAAPGADDAALRSIVLSAIARTACDRLRWRRLRGRAPTRSASELIQLYCVLGRLRARDQVAFAFHFIDGMDVRDVADALGDSLPKTDRRLARAWDEVAQRVRFSASVRVRSAL